MKLCIHSKADPLALLPFTPTVWTEQIRCVNDQGYNKKVQSVNHWNWIRSEEIH